MSKIICPKCGFADHVEDPVYCQNCGICLSNYCPDNNCIANNTEDDEDRKLPHNALYCPYCGSQTTFFEYLYKPEQ